MIRIAFVFLFSLFSAVSARAQGSPPDASEASYSETTELKLTRNAPPTYTVAAGDTLWGIAGKFLEEPWRWHELWRMSKAQVKNPQHIFPGDVLAIEYDLDKKPRLKILKTGPNSPRDYPSPSREIRLEPKIYQDQNGQSIPPIPPNVLEPFLSAPLVVDEKELQNAAILVAVAQDRVYLGKGDTAYVEGADPTKEFWQIYRDVKPLVDPEDPKQPLGYEAFYLGTAKQVLLGNPATFEILSTKEELGRGDRLLPSERPPLVDYVPHKPNFPLEGRIISIYGVPVHETIGTAGAGSIVAINRGERNGIEVGHVLAIARNRTVYGYDKDNRRISLKTPPERSGLLFIFRTFDKVAYGLIVHAEGVVETNDFVRTP
jgi:nucleoid-associated protein YgaU